MSFIVTNPTAHRIAARRRAAALAGRASGRAAPLAEAGEPVGGECRALVVRERVPVGAAFAKNPPLLFKGGDRGVVADAGASVVGLDGGPDAPGGHHPQTPSSEEEGASGCDDPARRTIFLPELKSRFLEHLSEFGNVRLACQRAGVSRQTAYREKRRAAGFAALWDAALLAARWHAEEALAERAINGVEEAVFYHGEEVARRRRYDSRLLLAHLGRLDKVAERVEAGAALAGLDDAIEALARGEEIGRDGGEEISNTTEPTSVRAELVEAPSFTSNGGTEESTTLRKRSCRHATPAQGERDLMDGMEIEKQPQDSVPCVPLQPCPSCGGACNGPLDALTQADCMWFGNRRDRMLDAVPAGEERATRSAIEEAEEAIGLDELHVDGFECGLEKWWLITTEAELEARLTAEPGEHG